MTQVEKNQVPQQSSRLFYNLLHTFRSFGVHDAVTGWDKTQALWNF